jgi:hypothetical protein
MGPDLAKRITARRLRASRAESDFGPDTVRLLKSRFAEHTLRFFNGSPSGHIDGGILFRLLGTIPAVTKTTSIIRVVAYVGRLVGYVNTLHRA